MNQFEKVMAERTDAQLIEIVTMSRSDYQQEALEAADAEFKRRDLSSGQVESVKQEVVQKHVEEGERANMPLQTHWKVLTFIFPGLINILFAATFKVDGYERRFKEAKRWTLYGVGFYGGIVLLIYILVTLMH